MRACYHRPAAGVGYLRQVSRLSFGAYSAPNKEQRATKRDHAPLVPL